MKSYYVYYLKNLNKEKTLNEISKITVACNVCVQDSTYSFCVDSKKNKKVDKYLKDKNIEILKKESFGLKHFFETTAKRIGVFIAVFIFIAFVLFGNNYIFSVEILGACKETEALVKKELQNSGIGFFCFKKSINKTLIENNLIKIENVSFASVVIKGNTLIVNIKDKLNNSEYTQKENFTSIKAMYDCKITSISLVQGTINVKVGDYVKKGYELVLPYTINSLGEKCEILPMADIKGEVFFTTQKKFYDEKLELVDTGNVVLQKTISCFNAIIYEKKQEVPYKYYRCVKNEKYISNNVLLPIKLRYESYFEQEYKTVKCEYEKNKQNFLNELKEISYKNLCEFDDIIKEYHFEEKGAGVNVLSFTVVVQKSIC